MYMVDCGFNNYDQQELFIEGFSIIHYEEPEYDDYDPSFVYRYPIELDSDAFWWNTSDPTEVSFNFSVSFV